MPVTSNIAFWDKDILYPEDGASRFFQNVSKIQLDYTATLLNQ